MRFIVILIICLLCFSGCLIHFKKKKPDFYFDPEIRVAEELDQFFGELDAKSRTLVYTEEKTGDEK